VRYRATITVDLQVEDVFALKKRREALKGVCRSLAEAVGPAELAITERRERRRPRAAPPERLGGEFQIIRAIHAGQV